jgi:hypothetical protein
VSLGAAWLARSPPLLGFGGDSAVELLSAAVVLWRFRSPSLGDRDEQRAARIAGGLLFVLAAFVALASVLTLLGARTRRSPAQSHRNRGAHPCGSGHALACEAKTDTFNGYCQRSVESRCH